MTRIRTALALLATVSVVSAAAAGGAAASAPHHYSQFESPSRNIGCALLDGVARCDILARSWSPPPRPATCPHIVDFGQGLMVAATGAARFVCAGDTAADPQAPILAYGQSDAVGALRCTSALTGMTCRSTRTGHGFFISRQRYSIF